MPYNRFDELNEEKKVMILETAVNIFAENSFKEASINKISKEAGLSAGSLYYYFEDKQDLFYTTIDYISKQVWLLLGDMKDAFAKLGYWEAITALVLKRLELNETHPVFMKLFQRVLLSHDPIELAGKEHLMAGFIDIFEYGYSEGYIRRDLPKSLLFSMHFNMTVTVNQWSLNATLDNSVNPINQEDLKLWSVKAVEMIRGALSVGEEK